MDRYDVGVGAKCPRSQLGQNTRLGDIVGGNNCELWKVIPRYVRVWYLHVGGMEGAPSTVPSGGMTNPSGMTNPIIEDDQPLYDWGIENRLDQYYQVGCYTVLWVAIG